MGKVVRPELRVVHFDIHQRAFVDKLLVHEKGRVVCLRSVHAVTYDVTNVLVRVIRTQFDRELVGVEVTDDFVSHMFVSSLAVWSVLSMQVSRERVIRMWVRRVRRRRRNLISWWGGSAHR